MEENLSCSMCGIHGELIPSKRFRWPGGTEYYILCRKCHSCGNYADTPEEAWDAWNTRPLSDRERALVEGGLEALAWMDAYMVPVNVDPAKKLRAAILAYQAPTDGN